MFGALVGDINGSLNELGDQLKSKDIELWKKEMEFTDDSACTLAVAEALIKNYPINYSEEGLKKISKDTVNCFIKYGRELYPYLGYGGMFYLFLYGGTEYKPYNSYGNGAAMRVSPVGWIANNETEVKLLSKAVTEVTHNHEEGIKGAEATAMCIYLARIGKDKEFIRNYIKENYYVDIDNYDYDDLLANYRFDVTCQGTVPVAIYCFLISNNFEDCLRTVISVGGDSDTVSAICMSIAEAYYQDKEDLSSFKAKVYEYIDDNMKRVIESFEKLV